jgi:hypothetical protein
MRAVWRLVAHELSTRWRSWAGLVLLGGLAGGVVLATAAGAFRKLGASRVDHRSAVKTIVSRLQ